MVEFYADSLRYVESTDRWLRYDGGAWRESKLGGQQASMDLLRKVYHLEGGLYSDVEERRGKKVTSDRLEFADWWKQQQSTARIKAAAEAVKFDTRLAAMLTSFDAEPLLLNAPNGVIDLANGELLPHDPALMLRRQIPVPYEPEAKAKEWEAFLERVMPSADMRDYLQRVVGYSITGRTSEQVVFFHIGPPASGKSVFLRVMEAILGELSRVVPSHTLLNKKMEQHPTDIMGMEGRRMLQVSETPEGARLDEALLKRLSGEETITARGMGQDFQDFRLVGKVHLVTNHEPHISDDPAVHRRLKMVPWSVTIPPSERDPGLADRIIESELPGVLAWAVRGALRWREDRLASPVESELAKSAYIAAEDEFGHFMSEELIVGAETFTASKTVYRRYRQWCDAQGMKAMSAVAFGRKLSARGVPAARTMHARGFAVALQHEGQAADPLA